MPQKTQPELTPEAVTDDLPTPREKGMIRADDGTSLYYEIRGEGRPIILNVGLTCRRRHWRHQIEHFSKNYSVISWDYRGHHASSLPSNDRHLTLEWCGRDLLSLARALRLEKPVVMGHSMGVPVITEAFRQSPGAFTAAVFVCGAVSNPFEHMFSTDKLHKFFRWYSSMYNWAPDWLELGWHQFTRRSGWGYFLTSRLGFNPTTAKSEDVWSYIEGVGETPLLVFLSLLDDYSRYEGSETLRQTKTPVLLIAGEKDFNTPFKVEQELAEILPRGELLPVPLGSHNAHADFPTEVNQAIEKFLKKVRFK